MSEKRVERYLIEKVIFPRVVDLSTPGFVIVDFKHLKDTPSQRERFLIEDVLVDLEKELKNKDKKARTALYQSSKFSAQSFASISKWPKVTDKFVKKKFGFVIKFVETMYARKLDFSMDLENLVLELDAHEYVVCRKSGGGLTYGAGFAGMWSYMCNRGDIEGIHLTCEGRGDPACKTVCAPIDYLKKNYPNEEIHEMNELNEFVLDDKYTTINTIKKDPKFTSVESIDSLMKIGTVKYDDGILTIGGMRLIPMENIQLDTLESYLKDYGDVIYNSAKKRSSEMIQNIKDKDYKMQDAADYTMRILSAMGFGLFLGYKEGDKYRIDISKYPWSEHMKSKDHNYLRGMIDGLIYRLTGEEVKSKIVEQGLGTDEYYIKLEI